MDRDRNLQEQPESTIGHRPRELERHEEARPAEPPREPEFAAGLARYEEAEESEAGAVIREEDRRQTAEWETYPTPDEAPR